MCTATVTTVGGLYLTTHSITATIIGTTAASLVTAWAPWLGRRDHKPSSVQSGNTTGADSDIGTDRCTSRLRPEPDDARHALGHRSLEKPDT